MRGTVRATLLAILCLAVSTNALAQGATGTISGSVKDETGAVLPGVTVQVRNMDTSLTRDLTTDEGGRFTASNLPPGPYELIASLSGFSTVHRSGIRLTVGREAVVDFTLAIGTTENRIEVVGEAPTVETTTGSTGGLIAEEQIKGSR
jgi:hypothetical protein